MVHNINKIIAYRLFFVWIGLSLIIGGGVYYFEHSKIGEDIRDLALRESGEFDQTIADNILNNMDSQLIKLLSAKVNQLTKKQFVVVEIYDKNKEHLVISNQALPKSIIYEIESRRHQFPHDKELHYDSFSIGKQLYSQVLIPLTTSKGELAGYFDGVYYVKPAELAKIRNRTYGTLIFVLVIILISAIVLYPLIISLHRELIKYSSNLLRANIQLMEVLGSAIAARDTTTNSHNYRVTIYAVRLGEALQLNSTQIRDLMAGSFLHDVGKIGINDAILRKPGSLTAEETTLMREHVNLGLTIVEKAKWARAARDIIEFHHERYDGQGYMKGLKGDEIPLSARVFSIVDVFDALTSSRPYKKAFEYNKTMEILNKERGLHFDPQILDVFTGIAQSLYETIRSTDDAGLETMLTELEDQYFLSNTKIKQVEAL